MFRWLLKVPESPTFLVAMVVATTMATLVVVVSYWAETDFATSPETGGEPPASADPAVPVPPDPQPVDPEPPGIRRGGIAESGRLLLSLAIAVGSVVFAAASATLVHQYFVAERPDGSNAAGDAFPFYVRVFAWMVGSVTAGYTILRLAELVIENVVPLL